MCPSVSPQGPAIEETVLNTPSVSALSSTSVANPDLDAASILRKRKEEEHRWGRELNAKFEDQLDRRVGIPWNQDVGSLFTDLYQITMSYAYFKANKHEQQCCFEVFFRTSPFKGEFTVFAGVDDVLRYLNTFRFKREHIEYLMELIPHADPKFFRWLASVDASMVTIYAIKEGTFVFPKEPLMRIEGPLAVCQLLETTILTLLNFASLVATNAARYRLAVSHQAQLLEFGMRRAQGPDGAMSASRYCFLGGFDATSNVRASFLFGFPCRGTHAHAFVTSFKDLKEVEIQGGDLDPARGANLEKSFVDLIKDLRVKAAEKYPAAKNWSTNDGELAAFVSYAISFPLSFVSLVDTYDVLASGSPNYAIVALALQQFGYPVGGIRIDSGDLAYLSRECRSFFNAFGEVMGGDLTGVKISVSNSINEEVLHSLEKEGHSIDAFGIGTHLVTCHNQPALGMVFKLCEINGSPVMKICEDISKTTFPCRKQIYRFYDAADVPILDFMEKCGHEPPRAGERVYCQHVSDSSKRCFVIPTRIEKLLVCAWKHGRANKSYHDFRPITSPKESDKEDQDALNTTALRHPTMSKSSDDASNASSEDLEESASQRDHLTQLINARARCLHQLRIFRRDHLRYVNPTPYRISTSKHYAALYKSLWDTTAPMRTYA